MVEILDRCSVCVASKRSAQYYRVTVAHTAPRATVCAACLDSQATVTECRLKEGHRDPGVSTNVAVSDLQSYKLPQCCTQLTSLSLSKDKAGFSTYTGYMRGYTGQVQEHENMADGFNFEKERECVPAELFRRRINRNTSKS